MGLASQGLRDYEAYLDTLDRKLTEVDGTIYVRFDVPLSIPASDCVDLASLKRCALKVREVLKQNTKALPTSYVVGRFLRLAIQKNHLALEPNDVLVELASDLGVAGVSHI